MNEYELSNKIVELSNKKTILKNQLKDKTNRLEEISTDLENHIKARHLIAEVAKNTQQLLQKRVESLVTSIIQSVFDRPFVFKLNFEIKRNKAECNPLIIENDNEFDIEKQMGGSIVDIIGFALRIIMYSLQNPKTRNTIILDEPFRFCGKYSKKAGQMVKELSQKMNLQFIIVTHDRELVNIADKYWELEHDGIKTNIIGE